MCVGVGASRGEVEGGEWREWESGLWECGVWRVGSSRLLGIFVVLFLVPLFSTEKVNISGLWVQANQNTPLIKIQFSQFLDGFPQVLRG